MSKIRELALRVAYLTLPSLMVVLAAMAVIVARGEALPISYGKVAGYRDATGVSAEDRLAYLATFERALHEERARNALPRLERSAALDRVAQAYAEDMASRRFFDHVSPDGKGPSDRVALHSPDAIIFGVRENLSYAHSSHPDPVWMRAQRAHGALMDSPGHRQNILHRDSTHVGIGMKSIWRDGVLVDYVVQLFGHDVGTWTMGRPRRTVESDRMLLLPIRLTRPDVEFMLDSPDDPHRLYTNLYSNRTLHFEGSVRLRPDASGANLEVPGLAPGTYAIHARLKGRTRGWYRVLQFEVEPAPRHAMGAP
jgi:uncharacterized protein YkwD